MSIEGISITQNIDTTSKNNLPVIRTDLVLPLKALEIYRDRIISSLNASLKVAQNDLKECSIHSNDRGWDLECREVETKIYWLKECKKRLYISRYDLESAHSRNFYYTRNLKEPQKKSFAWRNQVLLRDDFTCKQCGIRVDLQAHHIYSYKHEPDLRYDVNNGITFCSSCHKAFHRIYGFFANMDDLILFLGVSD